jgi:heme-degrading monooxygenase HmoA
VSVRSVIRFTVKLGREAEFEAAFGACGMLTRPRAIAGYLEAELVRGLENPAEYLVIGRWADQAAYAAWQARSLEGVTAEQRQALLDTLVDPRPGAAYAVVAASV